MDKANLNIKPGTAIKEERLFDYYQKKYPYRLNFFRKNWRWRYHLEQEGSQLPRVLEYDGKVLGLGSGIPFPAMAGDKAYKGQWFVDLSIDPDYRRYGLGTLLTKDYMQSAQIHLGLGNDMVVKLLMKVGWKLWPHSHWHFFLIRPLKYPKFRRLNLPLLGNLFNATFRAIVQRVYKKHAAPLSAISVEPVNSENLKAFENSERQGENVLTTQRTADYLKWRFLQSPGVQDYQLLSIKDSSLQAILKTIDGHVEVLMFREPLNDAEYIRLFASICWWAVKNDFDYVLSYTTQPERSKELLRQLFSLRRYQNYIYFAEDAQLQAKLEGGEHYWYLGDSDLEKFGDVER